MPTGKNEQKRCHTQARAGRQSVEMAKHLPRLPQFCSFVLRGCLCGPDIRSFLLKTAVVGLFGALDLVSSCLSTPCNSLPVIGDRVRLRDCVLADTPLSLSETGNALRKTTKCKREVATHHVSPRFPSKTPAESRAKKVKNS